MPSVPPTTPSALLRYDAAIIDLDGTMVDTVGDFEQAVAGLLQELGRPPLDSVTVSHMVGKGSEHLVAAALKHVGLEHDFDDALARYYAHYARVNGRHSTVFPGVPEGLAALRTAGLQLACLTNKPVLFARALLQEKGLDGYFSHVFGGDSYPRKKPDPLPLRETCKALGSLPSRTLAIGDSRNDAEAARAAGCRVLLVTYGYNHGEPIHAVDADFFVDTLEAVPAVTGMADA
ncbi:MAG: phosphoglycolate phosphatase [Pseudomonadota bacterium]